MPKRVVDGDAIATSEKLLQVEPPQLRAEFALLLTLALANGVFECADRRVWAKLYAYNRPDVTLETVQHMLLQYESAGMLFRWKVEGKLWGYWIGIDKPGRLPGESRRGRNEKVGPEPPKAELEAFLGNLGNKPFPCGNKEFPDGNEKFLGFGFGSGLGFGQGSGLGIGSEPAPEVPTTQNQEQEQKQEQKPESVEVEKPAPKPAKAKSPEQKLADQFFRLLGKPKKHANSADQWIDLCRNILSECDADYELVRGAMKWAMSEDDFWPPIIMGNAEPMKFFHDKWDKIIGKYRGVLIVRKNAEKKLASAEVDQVAAEQRKAENAKIPSLYAMPGK